MTERRVASLTDRVHVDALRERARVLARLDQPVGERLRDEVELDELASARQLLVVLLGAAVQAKHDRRHVAEYRRAHQRYNDQPRCCMLPLLHTLPPDHLTLAVALT